MFSKLGIAKIISNKRKPTCAKTLVWSNYFWRLIRSYQTMILPRMARVVLCFGLDISSFRKISVGGNIEIFCLFYLLQVYSNSVVFPVIATLSKGLAYCPESPIIVAMFKYTQSTMDHSLMSLINQTECSSECKN